MTPKPGMGRLLPKASRTERDARKTFLAPVQRDDLDLTGVEPVDSGPWRSSTPVEMLVAAAVALAVAVGPTARL